MGLTPEHRPRWKRKGDPTNLVIPDKTPDDRRYHERRKADQRARIIDRGWLGLLTLLWVWTALSISAKQDQINDNRIVGTSQRCELAREILRTLDDFNVPEIRKIRIRANYEGCLSLLPQDERERVRNAK